MTGKNIRLFIWVALLAAGCALLMQSEYGPYGVPGLLLVASAVCGLVVTFRR